MQPRSTHAEARARTPESNASNPRPPSPPLTAVTLAPSRTEQKKKLASAIRETRESKRTTPYKESPPSHHRRRERGTEEAKRSERGGESPESLPSPRRGDPLPHPPNTSPPPPPSLLRGVMRGHGTARYARSLSPLPCSFVRSLAGVGVFAEVFSS